MKTNMTYGEKCALLLFTLVAVIKAQDLKCYVCDDCESGYQNSLQTCQSGNEVTSSPTGEPTAAPTAAPTASPTEIPTVAPTVIPPDIPTTTDSSTTSQPTITDSSTTSEPTITDSSITTEPTITDSSTTREPTITDSSTTSQPTITDSSTTSESTITDSSTTSEPTITDSTTTLLNTEIQQEPEANVIRSKRETTTNVTRCVVTSYQGYNKTIVKRGCSFGEMEDEVRCRNLIGNNYNETLKRCYICNENGCNSATNLVISFITFALSNILLKTF